MKHYSYDEWLEDLQECPEDERRQFIFESLRPKHMLPIFGRYYFPDQIIVEENEDLPECQYEFAHEIGLQKHSALIEPRGHGKTTWTRIDLIHDIVYKHEPFIVLVGITSTEAKRSFAFVKSQLEINELLRDIYGNLVPKITGKHRKKWTNHEFETTNSVYCIAIGKGKGRGLNVGGNRPTKVVIDDMEDKKKVKRESQRAEDKEWLTETLIPAIDRKRGKVKMIGTVLHYACLVLWFHQKYGGVKRAAIENEKGDPDLNGTPIWWKREELDEKLEDIGSFAFAQEYMNDPKSDEYSDVKLAWIKRRESINMFDVNDRQLWKVFSALDPNIKEKESADEAAICTVAREIRDDGEMKIVVLNIEHGRWGLTKGIQNAKRVFDRYHHEKFGIESVAFSEHFRQIAAQNGLNASPINAFSDKRARLQSIVGLIEFGNIEFMAGCEDLITQLVEFPNSEHDDMVDAFVYAVIMARGAGKKFMMEQI